MSHFLDEPSLHDPIGQARTLTGKIIIIILNKKEFIAAAD